MVEVEEIEPGDAKGVGNDKSKPHPFKVTVIYNGVPKLFTVRSDELVKKLLEAALAAFGPIPNPHTQSIWKGGEELKDDQTLEQAGVEPNDTLLLRPSKVKGGR